MGPIGSRQDMWCRPCTIPPWCVPGMYVAGECRRAYKLCTRTWQTTIGWSTIPSRALAAGIALLNTMCILSLAAWQMIRRWEPRPPPRLHKPPDEAREDGGGNKRTGDPSCDLSIARSNRRPRFLRTCCLSYPPYYATKRDTLGWPHQTFTS